MSQGPGSVASGIVRWLLALTGLLLALMPVMEHCLTFDRYLRGGQDFELSVLSFLLMLGLVFLMGWRAEAVVAGWMHLVEWVRGMVGQTVARKMWPRSEEVRALSVGSGGLGWNCLPLRI